MPYVVVNDFKDTHDNNYFYEAGKTYPREGYEPTEERIKELSSVHPKYKRVFIKEVKDDKGTQTDDGNKKGKSTKKSPSTK